MPKHPKVLFFVLVLVAVSAGPAGSLHCADADEAVFLDTPFPPYVVGEVGHAPTGGTAVRIAQEVFGRMGVSLRIELVPWRRALKSAETGRSDGILLMMETEERREYMVFTDVLCEGREVFVYNRGLHQGFQWERFADLRPFTIGLVEGYTYGAEFLRAVEELGLNVDYAGSSEQNLAKLAAGRIDLALEEAQVTASLLKRNPEWRTVVAVTEKPVTVYPYRMGFSRSSWLAERVPEANRTLRAMREDGTIDRYLGEYE